MSDFDLTNKSISDTFQNLIQTTGSSAYNLVGQEISTFGVSGSFATSTDGGTKMYNGSKVSGSISVANKTNSVGGLDDSEKDGAFVEFKNIITVPTNRANKLHSRGGNLYWGDTLLADGTTVTGLQQLANDPNPSISGPLNLNNNKITGSGNIDISGKVDTSQIKLKENSSAPDVEVGGMYYDSTTGEFYLGKND
tara:strand:+ start:887 stop:1471 length:585 start_codon:yes stop_codon:yes gene_type:complete